MILFSFNDLAVKRQRFLKANPDRVTRPYVHDPDHSVTLCLNGTQYSSRLLAQLLIGT